MAALMERALSPLAGRETEVLRVLRPDLHGWWTPRTEPHPVGLTSCPHTLSAEPAGYDGLSFSLRSMGTVSTSGSLPSEILRVFYVPFR